MLNRISSLFISLLMGPLAFAQGAEISSRPLAPEIQRDFQTPAEASKKIGALARRLKAQGDRRSLFAGIYSLTIQSADLKLRARGFENPEWVTRLVVNYANLYRRTLKAELEGHRNQVPQAWQSEFQYIEDTRIDPANYHEGQAWSPDLDVVYGIHVHIKRDLVEALWITGANFHRRHNNRIF